MDDSDMRHRHRQRRDRTSALWVLECLWARGWSPATANIHSVAHGFPTPRAGVQRAARHRRLLTCPRRPPSFHPQDFTPPRFIFDGSVTIVLNTTAATNEIALHSQELYIKSASLTVAGGAGAARTPDAINFDTKLKTVTFVFGGDAIPAGEGHALAIEYEGCMNNQMAGFYRSGYTDAKGEKRIMGSTQFEALDARRAFPCVDEPAAKAVFGMTLVVNAAQHAFSNMPEISSSLLEGGEKKKIVFKKRTHEPHKNKNSEQSFCMKHLR